MARGENHGPENYEAESIRRICGGNFGGDYVDCYRACWDSGEHDTRDYWGHRGSGIIAAAFSGTLGSNAADCLGLGSHDTWSWIDGRDFLSFIPILGAVI
jgi:hypothetical protein